MYSFVEEFLPYKMKVDKSDTLNMILQTGFDFILKGGQKKGGKRSPSSPVGISLELPGYPHKLE